MALGWSGYQDANPVPTRPLADDINTAPSGPTGSYSEQAFKGTMGRGNNIAPSSLSPTTKSTNSQPR